MHTHIIDCIGLFAKACLGGIYVSIILMACFTLLMLLQKLTRMPKRKDRPNR